MKILVLGNGFDIDHGLPTSYMDFLTFCICVKEINFPKISERPELKELQREYIKVLLRKEKERERFENLIKGNHLIHYFEKRQRKLGDNWIDFEREIKEIVNVFRAIELEVKRSDQYCYIVNKDHKVHQILRDLGLKDMDKEQWDEISLATLHRELCLAYWDFSKALEYYISIFINTTPIQGISPDIIGFDANKVISFNYSNTYERIYGGVSSGETVDYVHGKASDKIEDEPDIVLGITSDRDEEHSGYVEFEKYFQRITKKTGNEYKKWLQARKDADDKIEVMFFGHSLDSSDSDIIRDLIKNKNSVIYIYYFNEKAHQQIVANLVEIIGKDELISGVSGNNPKIQLIKQQVHQNDGTAGLEITRDTSSLYRLHLLGDVEIRTLLEKIEDKISTKDIAYFYSQRKTISLYEALKCYGIEFVHQEDFLEVCELLEYNKDSRGRVELFDKADWVDYSSWGEEIPCTKATAQLIHLINVANVKRFQTLESEKPYAYVLNLQTSVEIKDALLEVFKEKNPTREYWKQLDALITMMEENENFEEALNLLQTEQLPLYVRVKRDSFIDRYNDYMMEKNYKMLYGDE